MSLLDNLKGAALNTAITAGTNLISGIKNKSTNLNKNTTGGLQQFLSTVSAGNNLFRGTFFEVTFGALQNADSMRFLCHQGSFPGYNVETVRNSYYGLPYETPTGISFDPAWFTCYVDNNFTVPSALYNETFTNRFNKTNWSPTYRDPSTLFDINIVAFTPEAALPNQKLPTTGPAPSPNSVSSTSSDGLPMVSTYVLKHAFIKSVQQMQLDWGAHNNISSITFEISYEWYDAFYPGSHPSKQQLQLSASGPQPLNFDTIIAKYPALGPIYDATKRTILQSPLMNNSIINQASQFLPSAPNVTGALQGQLNGVTGGLTNLIP